MKPHLSKRYVLFIGAALASLAACQQEETPLPPKPAEPLETNNSPASPTVQDPVFPSHLKRVCEGEPVQNAASYQTSTQTTHPTYLVYRDQPNDNYLDQSGLNLLPAAWEKEWDNLHEIELVLCVNKKQQPRSPVRTCEFKSAQQPTYTLEMYDTRYDAELREAKTSALIAYQELFVSASETCPDMHMFVQGQTLDQLEADYTQAIRSFASPYAETASK